MKATSKTKHSKVKPNSKVRRNRHGTLIRKKSGLYMARFIVGRQEIGETQKILADGKIKTTPKYKYEYIWESTGAYDHESALEFLRKRTADLALDDETRCLERIQDKKDAISFKRQKLESEKRIADEKKAETAPAMALLEAFAYYKTSTKRPYSGERTLRDYEGQYGTFIDWVATAHPNIHELREITPEIAEEFAIHMRSTRAPATHNHYIIFLRSFWNTLMHNSYARLSTNPWSDIRNLPTVSVVKKPFTVDMLKKFIPLLPDDYKKLCAIALYTGMRLEDAATLTFEMCDCVQNYIQFMPQKTKAKYGLNVIVPIHPVLREILLQTPEDDRKGYVLPDIANSYLREPSLVTNRFQKALVEAGIPTKANPAQGMKARTLYGFHSFRHMVNSWLIDHNIPSMVVAKIVCHKVRGEAMTAHYYHENLEVLTRAIGTLPYVDSFNIIAPNSILQHTSTHDDTATTSLEKFRLLLGTMTPSERVAAQRLLSTTNHDPIPTAVVEVA